MTNDEKLEQMAVMLECDCDADVFNIYLNMAKNKILNRRYPYGTTNTEVEPQYDQLHVELAIYLYNLKGAEGEKSHDENGVKRAWRSENEILGEIVPFAGVPNL